MDHPADYTPIQPWRTAAMIATVVAVIELFILLMIAFLVGAKAFSSHTETATVAAIKRAAPNASGNDTAAKSEPSGKPEKAKPKGPLPRGRTTVVVLNGNGIPGAAAVSADKVHSFHYVVTATGNAPRTDFSRSVVMFRPGFKPAAQRLAKDVGVKRVSPLDGITKGDLQGAQIALIIGG
ncbi:MAG TPA: LytR C-terminal domain-containing protein [Gaiellaceae bacterium]|jgi:hypothetical protein